MKLSEELELSIRSLDRIDNEMKWAGHHELVKISTKAINDLMKVRNELIKQEENND
jgi:hypothetical protein